MYVPYFWQDIYLNSNRLIAPKSKIDNQQVTYCHKHFPLQRPLASPTPTAQTNTLYTLVGLFLHAHSNSFNAHATNIQTHYRLIISQQNEVTIATNTITSMTLSFLELLI